LKGATRFESATLQIVTKRLSELVARGFDHVFEPGDPGYEQEVAGFNAAVVHRPDVVVGARSTEDVVRAVQVARDRKWRLAVQSTGHGTPPIAGGLLVTTRRMNGVQVAPAQLRATVGAGARWGAVVAAAAPQELAPIAGSSPTVGVVGFLLGGGIGPFVRSHGFGSDYLVAATLVDGRGETVTANLDENPEVLWALRGGRPRLGVVTEIQIQLAHMPALYAGSLFYDEADIEAALRGWIAWLPTADSRVTTSAAVVRFPPSEMIPAPLRARRLLALRFAYPGDATEGARLAAPLRAMAPVHLDELRALPLASVAQIFNDPPGPLPSWTSAGLLTALDQDLASTWLRHFGPRAETPFLAAELRHLGEATTRDIQGGSAVGGRAAQGTFALIGANPAAFAALMPDAEARLIGDLGRWLSPEFNGNFAANTSVRRPLTARVPASVAAKLDALARRHDPDGLFAVPT